MTDIFKGIGLALFVLSSTLLWVGSILLFGGGMDYMVPSALVAFGIGGYLTYAGMQRKPWALLGICAGTIIFCNIVFRVREQGAAEFDAQNGIKVASWLIMLVLCCANPQAVRFCADPVIFAWAVFCAIAFASAVYSSVPMLTTMAALGMTVYLGFACLLIGSVSIRRVSLTLVIALTVYCITNWVVALIAPDVAWIITDEFGHERFQGISGHPNTIARAATLYLFLTFAAYYRGYLHRTWFILLSVLASGTILATLSRSAIIGVCLCFLLQARRLLLPLMLLSVAAATVIVVTNQTDTVLTLVGREGDADEAVSMSGRTELWVFVLDQIAQRPLVGHGYDSFEANATDLWYGDRKSAVAAHNNYLEVLYSVGIIGTLPFITAIVLSLYRWIKEPYPPRDVLMLNVIINGLVEVDITTIAVLPTLMIFIVLAMDTVETKRVKQSVLE